MLWLVKKLLRVGNFTIMVTIDIDECSMQVDECDHNCNNTLGSYTCSCDDGYSLDRNGLQCNGKVSTALLQPIIIMCPIMCPIMCRVIFKILTNALYNWISVIKSVSISMDRTHVNVMKDMQLSATDTMLVRVSQN